MHCLRLGFRLGAHQKNASTAEFGTGVIPKLMGIRTILIRALAVIRNKQLLSDSGSATGRRTLARVMALLMLVLASHGVGGLGDHDPTAVRPTSTFPEPAIVALVTAVVGSVVLELIRARRTEIEDSALARLF
ncbi:MAG TPA: hypothetical protein DCY82_01555 [Acidimicrobiaceae bacterium]|nr:hypothetical protein [Acidimicrobiaceae bacterium]